MPLERAVGWYEASERGARLIGAPVAGLLVATLGALPVLALDAVTFAVSALVVTALVPRSLRPATPADPAGGGYWREFAAGVRFLAREPLLRAVVLLVLVTNFFDATKSNVLLPVVADRELGGPTAFGLLVGAMGGRAGRVTGVQRRRPPAAPPGHLRHRLRRSRCAALLGAAAAPPLPWIVAVFALSGFAAGAINPLIGALKLERVPAHMRARVYGVIGAAAWAAIPLGALAAGVAVDRFGTTPVLLTVGCCYLLVVLTPLLGGPWRTLDRPGAPARPAQTPTPVG